MCREYLGVVDWFPERGATLEPARRICARCLVRTECLDYAMTTVQRDGVWAGTSAKQRQHAVREVWTPKELLAEIDTRAGSQ